MRIGSARNRKPTAESKPGSMSGFACRLYLFDGDGDGAVVRHRCSGDMCAISREHLEYIKAPQHPNGDQVHAQQLDLLLA